MTGILKVSQGDSRINGTLLGRKGNGDPYGAATGFLADSGCRDGDCVTVTGTQEDDAFYIDSASKEASSKCKPVVAMVTTKGIVQVPTLRKGRLSGSRGKAKKSTKSRAGKRSSAKTKKTVNRRKTIIKRAPVSKKKRRGGSTK